MEYFVGPAAFTYCKIDYPYIKYTQVCTVDTTAYVISTDFCPLSSIR